MKKSHTFLTRVVRIMRDMKDSSISYIGKIPKSWNISRYKYHSCLKMGETLLAKDTSQFIDIEHTIPVYSAVQDDSVFGYVNRAKANLKKNDIVIPARGNSIGCATIIRQPLATSTQTTICSYNIKNIYPEYLYYCNWGLKSQWYKYDGSAIPQITVFQVANNYLPLPKLQTQKQIADFLDRKCSEIDALRLEIEKGIAALKEYKKSIITETVTKGLNKNVPMKDSGIEWIGQMPKSWRLITTKYCFKIENGSDPITSEGETPVYGSGSKNFKTCTEFKQGPTVLLGRKGTINIPRWVEGRYWNIDTAFNVKPKNGSYNLKLFYYVSVCFDYERYSTQTALPSMTQDCYNNFKLPYTNLEEQKQIADYLDRKCSKIDDIIEAKNKQLSTLDEYKKSLIYEYVTGKKEVPSV